MGRKSRPKPLFLAQKLVTIRQALGLSQNELLSQMGFQGELDRSRISEFEKGAEPPLLVVL